MDWKMILAIGFYVAAGVAFLCLWFMLLVFWCYERCCMVKRRPRKRRPRRPEEYDRNDYEPPPTPVAFQTDLEKGEKQPEQYKSTLGSKSINENWKSTSGQTGPANVSITESSDDSTVLKTVEIFKITPAASHGKKAAGGGQNTGTSLIADLSSTRTSANSAATAATAKNAETVQRSPESPQVAHEIHRDHAHRAPRRPRKRSFRLDSVKSGSQKRSGKILN